MENKINIFGCTLPELENHVISIGEKKFRAKQIYQWLYQNKVESFEEMTNISKNLRNNLSEKFNIEKLSLSKKLASKDKTQKLLFELSDKNKIESVLLPPISVNKKEKWIPDEEVSRFTICISSQIGCPLGCTFCATGYMKYKRDLTTSEILNQVYQGQKECPSRITNVVFMGMGEPLLNYANVVKSIGILNDDNGLNISKKHITVSTAGIIPVIKQIAEDDKKFKLAVSLHSTDNEIRSKIMPINKKYPVRELIESVKYYYSKTKIRPTFEYILFDNINDTDIELRNIISLSKQFPCKFNFIKFHNSEFLETNLKPSKKFDSFVEILRNSEVTVMVRNSSGADISAACGQLAILNK